MPNLDRTPTVIADRQNFYWRLRRMDRHGKYEKAGCGFGEKSSANKLQ
jgi:hypothetical protein